MGLGDADEPGLAVPHPFRHLLHVEAPPIVEVEVHHVEVGTDRPWGLEVRGVVGADDDGVVPGLEERGGDAEQRRRRRRR